LTERRPPAKRATRRKAVSTGLDAEHRATLEALFDAVHVVDADLRFVLINAAFRRWLEQLGVDSDVVGRRLFEAFSFLPERIREEYRRVFERGEIVVTEESTPLASGVYHTETRKIPIVVGGKVVRVVTVVHDVTARKTAEAERRRLDERLQQIHRLEGLGVLAGGIAHDFNNLLMAVLGNLAMAREAVVDPVARRDIEEAERAGRQAIALTQQLLTFAKGGAPRKQKVHLASLVRETAEFCLRGSTVRAEFDLHETFAVAADVGQVGQAIQNLVLNAKEAMPQGGTVRLTTEDAGEEGRRCVSLTVADEGCGIPEAILPRIYEPYFTTKSGGSGLGLAVTHSVIGRHGGRITVQSEVGRGTRFTVLLPALERVPAHESPLPAERPSRALRVLLMDDETALRTLLAQMLRQNGHMAVPAREGGEAVELYAQSLASGRPFDVVLLDLTVPGGMGGKEAAAGILRLDQRARLVVSSGYSEDPVVAQYREFGFVAALGKPYGADELLAALARAVGDDS
jgi:two-component system cell cycle sensor histidine kinase/response regulator CckA